jgi:RNA 2',3'-cyclic 3'-phosphodiesterase
VRDGADPGHPERMRLFCAIEIPESVRVLIERAFSPWRERFPSARWVPPENWHITLRFLGSVQPGSVSWVEERLAEVAGSHHAIGVRVSGVGCFPALRARVLWAGLDGQVAADEDGLAVLADALDEAVRPRFPADPRPFAAHLTVARIRGRPISVPEGYLATELRSDPFTVGRIVLFRSHLGRPAPRYEPLASFPLSDRPAG